MKTVFEFKKEDGLLTAYQLGSEEKANYAIQNLLVNAKYFVNYEKEFTFLCDSDIGPAHFIHGEGRQVYICRREGETSPYTYCKALLPKELLGALNCMRQTCYYDPSISKKIEDPLNFKESDDLFLDEKQVLLSARKNLMMASAFLMQSNTNHYNLEAVLAILESISLQPKKEYKISLAKDLIDVFEEYGYPMKEVLKHYLSVSPKVKTVEEFLPSIMIPTKDPLIQNERQILRQSMKAFSLTPDWVQFAGIVEINKEKVRKLIR